MTPNQYERDTRIAIDQNTRRTIYEGQDFRQLNFRYIQPPLQAGGEICDYLDLCAKGVNGDKLPATAVREHLNRFFALSFPEGTNLEHPALTPMQASLNQPDVALLPTDRFRVLSQHVSIDTLKQSSLRRTLQGFMSNSDGSPHADPRAKLTIGEIMQFTASDFYGPEGLKLVADVLPRAVERLEIRDKLRTIPASEIEDAVRIAATPAAAESETKLNLTLSDAAKIRLGGAAMGGLAAVTAIPTAIEVAHDLGRGEVVPAVKKTGHFVDAAIAGGACAAAVAEPAAPMLAGGPLGGLGYAAMVLGAGAACGIATEMGLNISETALGKLLPSSPVKSDQLASSDVGKPR